MQRRLPPNDHVVKFVDDFRARNPGSWKRFDVALLIAVNHDGLRQGSKIGAFAAHDDESKMIVRDVAPDAKGVAACESVGAAVLHFDLVGNGLRISQDLSRATIGG